MTTEEKRQALKKLFSSGFKPVEVPLIGLDLKEAIDQGNPVTVIRWIDPRAKNEKTFAEVIYVD